MTKIRKIKLSFIITFFGLLILIVLVAVLGILIALKRQGIENDPYLQGMYPSVGLGKYFAASRLDYLIDAYSLEIATRFGVPQYYDRVLDLINENYILVGDTYYYRDYLAANPFLYDVMPFIIAFIVLIVMIFIFAISVLLLIKANKEDREELKLTKKRKFFLVLTCYFSLNIYSAIKVFKWKIEDEMD